ncbi:unnamed protein product [Clonostachys chloroleuca]|uniref:Uncharacterized protein n=1 Tax=Clonostachys chloroleuca TaxID=1926264 RepID=A0AA35LU04_9HYPO|nr:unnamed protein product [Clonostachys chloroleuca]
MRGDAEEAFLAYGTYHEPPFDGLEMNDYYDLVVLNDAADGQWNSEERTDDYMVSNIITSFLEFHPTYLVEFERFLQVKRWRNTLTNPVMREDRPEENPATLFCLFRPTAAPQQNQIVSEWESHVCRMDGPEFVRPDELEANAREIVGDNEEDVRLYLAQVALARDTNWRIL